MLCGCASLTSSQRKIVADYATLTQTYSQYPSQVARSYVDLTYDIDQLRIAADGVDSTAITRLLASYLDAETNRRETQRIDQSIGVIQAYASALEALSSADFTEGFGKNASLLGTNVDTLIAKFNKTARPATPIPIGFGKLAAEVLNLAGKRYINQRQAVALRAFMAKGDTVLQLITADVQTAMRPVKKDWVDGTLKPHLAAYYARLLSRSDPMSPNRFYYKYQLNKDVGAMVIRMASLGGLADALAQSVTTLSQAHHTVLTEIQKKRTVLEQVADLQQLYQATNEAYAHYQKLTTPAKTN